MRRTLQELLAALDVQQTTISAAHLRVGQQLKQLQVWHCQLRIACLHMGTVLGQCMHAHESDQQHETFAHPGNFVGATPSRSMQVCDASQDGHFLLCSWRKSCWSRCCSRRALLLAKSRALSVTTVARSQWMRSLRTYDMQDGAWAARGIDERTSQMWPDLLQLGSLVQMCSRMQR